MFHYRFDPLQPFERRSNRDAFAKALLQYCFEVVC